MNRVEMASYPAKEMKATDMTPNFRQFFVTLLTMFNLRVLRKCNTTPL